MEVIYGLVGITVLLVVGIAALLLWAIRSGQFDDMEGPAWRVLMDDDAPERPQPPAGERTGDDHEDRRGPPAAP